MLTNAVLFVNSFSKDVMWSSSAQLCNCRRLEIKSVMHRADLDFVVCETLCEYILLVEFRFGAGPEQTLHFLGLTAFTFLSIHVKFLGFHLTHSLRLLLFLDLSALVLDFLTRKHRGLDDDCFLLNHLLGLIRLHVHDWTVALHCLAGLLHYLSGFSLFGRGRLLVHGFCCQTLHFGGDHDV